MKLLLIILHSICIFASEEVGIKDAMTNIVHQIEQVPTFGSPPIKVCDNSVKATEIQILECSLASELNESIRINFAKEGYKYQQKLDQLTKACLKKRFDHCYPNLTKTIELDKLRSFFESWKKDPRFRYPSGAGMCAYRAQSLSYHLAELGFKTTSIRIEHSPTLIAMDRDSNDKLNGNYDDYRGYHTLVQIMVNRNGKAVPYLLDPQYMTEPLIREDYFIKTTGQNCKKLDEQNEKVPVDLTSCYYKEEAQNKPAEKSELTSLFNPSLLQDQLINCGWTSAKLQTRVSIWPGPINKNDTKIVCTNGEVPKAFEGKDVSETSSKELILSAYENYAVELNRQLDFTNDQIKILSDELSQIPSQSETKEMLQSNIEMKASIVQSLKLLKNKIIIVKKNIGDK
ncbi:MAG: hypothetical protein PHY93_19985 [Bacteriovorax sp.]|nr:hypothetical protein [Bacteriovorax sp.]